MKKELQKQINNMRKIKKKEKKDIAIDGYKNIKSRTCILFLNQHYSRKNL